jgi:alpha-tubulin suppressor-like RCC1 family protein
MVDEYIGIPTLVNFTGLNPGEKIISIAYNNSNALAISDNNRIFGWGDNSNNIFATSDTNLVGTISSPVLIDIEGIVENTIKMIYGNSNGTYYFVTTNQEIFAIGNNGNGQLANGNTVSVYGALTQITGIELALGDEIKLITLDGYSTMVLTEEGRIFVWAIDDWGKLLTLNNGGNQYTSVLEVRF